MLSLKLLFFITLIFEFVFTIEVVTRYDYVQCVLDKKLVKEIHQYKHVVNQIFDYVLHGEFKGKTYKE